MLIIGELSFLFDLTSSDRESFENLLDVGALLHGDNSKLIFFVDPDEECFVVVVVDTSGFRPVSFKTA